MSGCIHDIMKRTRHTNHYSVRRLSKNRFNTEKQKLAGNLSNSNILTFWNQVNKFNPASRLTPDVMDNASGNVDMSETFYHKYHSLYNSVPTNDMDMIHVNTID